MPGPSPYLAPDQWGAAAPDPRAADVQGVTQLLDSATAEGVAPLPMLSATELYALCGSRQVLTEEDEVRRWSGMSEAARAQLAAAATDFLLDRQLLRRPDHDSCGEMADLPMTPPLALITAARQYPAVVAAGTRPDGDTAGAPRLYGLGEDGRPLRAVVVEMITGRAHKLLGPLHEFVLMSPAKAGQALAAWAITPLRTGLRRQPQARAVSIYRHPPGQDLISYQFTITATRHGDLTVIREHADSDAPVSEISDQAGLTALLTGLLTEEQS
jgi:hypothetical protein